MFKLKKIIAAAVMVSITTAALPSALADTNSVWNVSTIDTVLTEATAVPSETSLPSATIIPTEEPDMTAEPLAAEAPNITAEPLATETPCIEATETTPVPSETSLPSATIIPTEEPDMTAEPSAAEAPNITAEEPAPTEESTPTITSEEEITETEFPNITEQPSETSNPETAEPSELSMLSSGITVYSANTSGNFGTGLHWEYDTGSLYIELRDGYKTGTMSNYSQLANIPWNANGWSSQIYEVYIDSGITNIGKNVFSTLSNLTSVYIDDSTGTSIEKIGYGAFAGCENLWEINLPETLEWIGDYAFENCYNLSSISLPEGLVHIGEKAFYRCTDLPNNLQIPSSVTWIGENAFSGSHTYLTDIYVNNYEGSISGAPWGFSGTVHWLQNIEIASVSEQYYTGEPIEPKITVTDTNWETAKTKTLTEGTDYTVSYSDNIYPGTATATVSYIGNYSKYSGNAKSVTFTISKPNISNATVSAISDYTYTGSAVTPNPTVTLNGNTLYLDTDYTLSYENNINAGTATITITGKDNITGTLKKTFTIAARAISSATVGSIASQTYTGSAISPAVTITYNSKKLVSGTDYTISYSNNTNVGTATVTITGKGNFTGTTTKTFEIVGINISGATVTFPEDITYQGEPCCPEPTVVINGKTLVKGTDYTIVYSNNNGEGTGTATITGIGSYIGSVSAKFEIGAYDPKNNHSPIDMSLINVSAVDNCTYDGTAHTPTPTLTYNVTDDYVYTLIEGEDYTVTYENNINAGTAKIILTGIQQGEGGFEGTKNVYFNIAPCELSATSIADIPSYEYCKVDICPEPEIKIGDVVLTKDVDYTLSYENNHNRGTATVTITGTGNLTGTVTKNFEITPRDGTKFVIIVWL